MDPISALVIKRLPSSSHPSSAGPMKRRLPPACPSRVAIGAWVNRKMARLLRLMRDREMYRSLGFVRLGDYVVERLGISYRGAQELMRVDTALEALPLTAAAFDSGEVTHEQVRLVTRVASPESEAYWLALARTSSVRSLARAAAAKNRGEPDGAFVDDSSAERLEIVAPAWVAHRWRQSVALVRRIAGGALPPGACFEMVLAEAADEISMAELDHDPRPDDSRPVGIEGPTDTGRISHDAGDSTLVLEPDAAAGKEPVSDVDARSADRELRRLNTEAQRRDAAMADHLRLVALDRGHRDLGYDSIEDYANERLGLQSRSLYHLLALGRALVRLPELRRAFLAGRLTNRQAILVGCVATRTTVQEWIRRAECATLRRLEDEITTWRHLQESRPRVWEMLDGGPMPEGLILAPGQPPRLHASASSTIEPSPNSPAAGVSAEQILAALAADEGSLSMPQSMCTIRLLVEPGVRKMWEAALAHLRAGDRADLYEWEALALLLQRFWSVWDNSETRRQRRVNPTIERDGWRCTAPGCRSEGTGRLHEHHIRFRSEGGTDDASNTTTLCTAHHLGLLHEGKIRCSGHAPGEIRWEMGVEPGVEPFLVYIGDRRIAGAAA